MKEPCTYREIAKYRKIHDVEDFKSEEQKLINSCAQRLKNEEASM